jgi:hypothetical protein
MYDETRDPNSEWSKAHDVRDAAIEQRQLEIAQDSGLVRDAIARAEDDVEFAIRYGGALMAFIYNDDTDALRDCVNIAIDRAATQDVAREEKRAEAEAVDAEITRRTLLPPPCNPNAEFGGREYP